MAIVYVMSLSLAWQRFLHQTDSIPQQDGQVKQNTGLKSFSGSGVRPGQGFFAPALNGLVIDSMGRLFH
jgi:hypothetical protein